jgi:hypothetical protein
MGDGERQPAGVVGLFRFFATFPETSAPMSKLIECVNDAHSVRSGWPECNGRNHQGVKPRGCVDERNIDNEGIAIGVGVFSPLRRHDYEVSTRHDSTVEIDDWIVLSRISTERRESYVERMLVSTKSDWHRPIEILKFCRRQPRRCDHWVLQDPCPRRGPGVVGHAPCRKERFNSWAARGEAEKSKLYVVPLVVPADLERFGCRIGPIPVFQYHLKDAVIAAQLHPHRDIGTHNRSLLKQSWPVTRPFLAIRRTQCARSHAASTTD